MSKNLEIKVEKPLNILISNENPEWKDKTPSSRHWLDIPNLNKDKPITITQRRNSY